MYYNLENDLEKQRISTDKVFVTITISMISRRSKKK